MEAVEKKKGKKAISLQYWKTGTGPPLIGIAGFGCAHWLLKPLAWQMDAMFTVWLPDNRGMGCSPKPDESFSIADMATDILKTVREEIREPVRVMGVSMGGFVVQHLLLMAPENFTAAAILCSTSGGAQFQKLFSFWSERQMEKVLEMDPDTYARWILAPAVSPCLTSYPQTFDYLLQQRLSHQEDARQVMAQYRAMTEFLAEPLNLGAITTPVMVACGASDPVFPEANSRLLARSLPKGELVVFPDTDHLFFVEKPREVGKTLIEFFLGNERLTQKPSRRV